MLMKNMKLTLSRSVAALVLALSLMSAAILPAQAETGDYCVVCSEPQQTYRCTVDISMGQGNVAQTACIRTLATEGRHGSCAIRRSEAGARCEGLPRHIASNVLPPLAGAPTVPPASPGEPQTVEEALKKMSSSASKQMDRTNDQLKKGAEATTSGIQRTFSCIASFFTRCGPQQ
jgi:hypothetical protein